MKMVALQAWQSVTRKVPAHQLNAKSQYFKFEVIVWIQIHCAANPMIKLSALLLSVTMYTTDRKEDNHIHLLIFKKKWLIVQYVLH